MALVETKTLPNRLVDYVLVVGSADVPPNKDGGVNTPKLLRRIPEADIHNSPLPPDVVFFCQPDGCYTAEMTHTEMLEQQKLFLFCLTEKDSNVKRFGTCLNFFRPCSELDMPDLSPVDDQADQGADTAERIHQERLSPLHEEDTSAAVQLDEAESSSAAAAGVHEAFAHGSSVSSDGGMSSRADDNEKCLGVLTSVCLLSHHGFFSTFKEILMTFRDLVEGCQVHGETVFDMESGWRRLIDPSLVETDQVAADLINWIHGLLNAPTPQPGFTCVEIELAIMPTLTLAYPDPSRFPLVDFPLHLPVDLLGPDRLIEVLVIVMLENKVVFQSRDYNLLSMCVMAIISLLFPLEYLFPIIPLLPTSMPNAETLLLAPSPYVIGVPASFFHPARGVCLPEDVYHIDLDSGQIDRPDSLPAIPLPPEKLLRTLRNRLERCLEVIHTMRFPSSPLPSTKESRGHNSSKPYTSSSADPSSNIDETGLSIHGDVAAGAAADSCASPAGKKPIIQGPKKLSGTQVDSNTHPLVDSPASSPWSMSGSSRSRIATGIAARTSANDMGTGGGGGGGSADQADKTTSLTRSESSLSAATIAAAAGADEIDGSLAADIVAVDVNIRVAFVQFILNDDVLANYRRFLRTIRLHSRPVVMLQKNGFLASVRSGASSFLSSLASTQALETFGEFELNPSTTVHWRVQQGITRAVLVGDKHKWYKDKLSVQHYSVYEGCESLSAAMLQAKSATAESDDDNSDQEDIFDSDSSWSGESSSNSSLILITDEELVGDDGPQTIKVVRRGIEEAVLPATIGSGAYWNASNDNSSSAGSSHQSPSASAATAAAASSSYADRTGGIVQHATLPSVNFTKASSSSQSSSTSRSSAARSHSDASEIVDSPHSAKAVDFSPGADSTNTADISMVTTHTSPLHDLTQSSGNCSCDEAASAIPTHSQQAPESYAPVHDVIEQPDSDITGKSAAGDVTLPSAASGDDVTGRLAASDDDVTGQAAAGNDIAVEHGRVQDVECNAVVDRTVSSTAPPTQKDTGEKSECTSPSFSENKLPESSVPPSAGETQEGSQSAHGDTKLEETVPATDDDDTSDNVPASSAAAQGEDTTDFFAANAAVRQVKFSFPSSQDKSSGSEDYVVPPLVKQYKHMRPSQSPGSDFEIVSPPIDYPETSQQLPIVQKLAEEFDSVSDAAMGFIGTTAEQTAIASTEAATAEGAADTSQRGDSFAPASKPDQTRLRQIRLVSRHSKKKVSHHNVVAGRDDYLQHGHSASVDDSLNQRGHSKSSKTSQRTTGTSAAAFSPLHTQLTRRSSNFIRRPLPMRSRSLSFNHRVDCSTGRALTPDTDLAEDLSTESNYDEAVLWTSPWAC
eukprot:scpid26232/ scgid20445/ MAP kinase-activating death domain protein; Differentially expressed in normal and neoplastic cells; Insulinoma glucagonoma clone 20; Rab3 GDP/GTP exchange factor